MPAIKFNSHKDFAPIPFDNRICQSARKMKISGLKWQPHVGCFVWDPENCIKQDSPFPNRIYFILSIPRFLDIFGDIDTMVEKLVWIPTWHQARQVYSGLNLPDNEIARLFYGNEGQAAGAELLKIYDAIIVALDKRYLPGSETQTNDIEKLSMALLTGRLGDITVLPENLRLPILGVYQKFTEAYLNILRQKENKPGDWFPQTLTVDSELANGMRHFYSDYQHITRQYYILNRRIDNLMAIDPNSQPNSYRESANEIMQLCAEAPDFESGDEIHG